MILSLVGGAKTTRDLYRQYSADEVWTLAYQHSLIDADYLFEMHRFEDVPPQRWELLYHVTSPVYMLHDEPDIPMAILYPIGHVLRVMPASFQSFCSTLDYMLALAIYKEVQRIQIFGFELEQTGEWFYQKPTAYYWIGLALGRGIDVFIPEQSKLWKLRLYGYEGYPRVDPQVIERLSMVQKSLKWDGENG